MVFVPWARLLNLECLLLLPGRAKSARLYYSLLPYRPCLHKTSQLNTLYEVSLFRCFVMHAVRRGAQHSLIRDARTLTYFRRKRDAFLTLNAYCINSNFRKQHIQASIDEKSVLLDRLHSHGGDGGAEQVIEDLLQLIQKEKANLQDALEAVSEMKRQWLYQQYEICFPFSSMLLAKPGIPFAPSP